MANFGSEISTFEKIFSETFKSIFLILICLDKIIIKKEQTIIRPKNLVKRQSKYQEEMDKISQRLSNKGFTERAPKNIVEQEKTNYSNLKDDIRKISLTIESL